MVFVEIEFYCFCLGNHLRKKNHHDKKCSTYPDYCIALAIGVG